MTDDDRKPKSSDSQSSIPVEVVRRNVDKMKRPAEYPRQVSPPVEEAQDDPATLPIVMSPELPSSPLALPTDDKIPIRPETGTLPFELQPPRSSATPATGIPKQGQDEPPSTQPLDMPLRTPASTQPVMVQMTEENTGVLSVTEDSRDAAPKPRISREISAAVDGLLDERPPEKPITVELVEENTGVLSAVDGGPNTSGAAAIVGADPPAKPISAAAAKLAAEKALAEKKARAERAAAERAVAGRATTDELDAVAPDKAAGDRKAAAQKAAAISPAPTSTTPMSAAADKAAGERAAAARYAAEKIAAVERADKAMAAATSAAAERAAERAAATSTAAEKAGERAPAGERADKATAAAGASSGASAAAGASTAATSTAASSGATVAAGASSGATAAAGASTSGAASSASGGASTAATLSGASTSGAASTPAGSTTSTAVHADDIEETITSEGDDKSDEDMVPWVAPDDGFQLANEIGTAPPQLIPNPPILPSPQEAALEAARIVSQMVDIESESGAVIAAAAAAGAAIEAAKAAHRASIDPRDSQPSMRIPSELTGAQGHDPITTVRLSRDRILAALADEDIAVPVPTSRAPGAQTDPARIRARTEPGIEEEGYEDFDPVAIAAAAIGRLRARARTDLAELRVHYHRHDILVLLLALVIIIVAGRVHENLVTPPTQAFKERGLTFVHPSTWLRPEPLPAVAPRLVRDPTGAAAASKDDSLYHVELSAVGSTAKLEVLIDKKPAWSNIVTGLELDRRSRWGELYTLDESSVKSIAGHDWLRTAYRYAHVVDKGDVPRVDHALEIATIDREQIYIVTIYGTPLEIEQIEGVVAPSLRVPSQTGLPLVPQTSRLSQRKYPTPVGRAFDSTVMVVVADLVDGRLKARGGGSGVIVGAEGSILTNYHVIHDKDGRLHDVFIIGRFSAPDRAPQLQCAGRPSRSKLQRDLDLALIKCDMDLDGRSWTPASSGIWATLPEGRTSDIKIGQRLWVLGYPDVGGGGLQLGVAEVEGWTGEDGAQGKDFIKTNGSITHGNSGGPVIDDNGKLVGIASAFRTRVTASGGVIETAQVGLVRPLQAASNLLAYAAAGWTPREGYTDVELSPTAVEAAAEGIRIFTTVIDDANEQPVRDATVMVLKAGVKTAAIDMNRLDDQAIAWGKTNALGEVRLKQLVPIPGTYTVMVVAPGYEPLIGENELHLDAKTPPSFDPWGKIGLRSR